MQSPDPHPTSRSSRSAGNTVKAVTDASSSLGQLWMKSSLPSGFYQDPSSVFLSHLTVYKHLETRSTVRVALRGGFYPKPFPPRVPLTLNQER